MHVDGAGAEEQVAGDLAVGAPDGDQPQHLELVEAGNRYGLPPFYELHAWLWKHNPSGFFEDWNPRVTCANA